jgi:predicted secreted Zn-dependent protease
MPSPNRPPSLVARHVAPLATTCFTLCLALGPAVVWAASEGHPAPEPGTGTRIEAQPGALLQALAYAPRDAVSVEFTDWAGLKLASGGEDVSSDSPLDEREALLLAIGRSEAVLAPLGLDLLDSWPAAWGWDTTDLTWQLDAVTVSGAPTVLRFHDTWDPAPFLAQLERHGFIREEGLGIISFAPGPEAWYDPGEALGRAFGLEPPETPGETSSEQFVAPSVGLTFVGDGRTVVVEREGTGRELARHALRRDPAAIAASPFGRVAVGLGEPLAALIIDGEVGCSGTGEENARLRRSDAQLAQAVGELHPYAALGAGYWRPGEEDDAAGRYIFDYARREHAESDLAGRVALIDQGLSADGRRPYRDASFTLAGAESVGHDLVLDVRPVDDRPAGLFDELMGRPYGQSGVLAICGPLPAGDHRATDVPMAQQATADLPLFAGPATLALSGGRGLYAWDEVHFGADQVLVTTTTTARQEPCAAYLVLEDRSDVGGTLASANLAAVPGEEARHASTILVDYATAALRVTSTCADWSVTFEPLQDPNLAYRVADRFYPVVGRTIRDLAGQANQATDGWTAYAGWDTDWQFWWQESGASCDVTHGEVELRARITYPAWRPPEGATPAVVARWDRFIEDLTTHELGHITIALQGADAIDELLDAGLSAPTCEQVEREANREASRLHERFERLNARYDEATDHGLAQGTGLP